MTWKEHPGYLASRTEFCRYAGTELLNTYKSVTVPRRMSFPIIYIYFLSY